MTNISQQIKYTNHYKKLILRAQLRANTKKEANNLLGYVETHHIIPRCMNGTNDKENLVFLTAREHFCAHLLLLFIHPNNFKLINAARLMCADRYGHRIHNRHYEWLRKSFSKEQSKRQRGQTLKNCERVRKGADTRRGRTKFTCVGLAKMAEARTGRTKDNHQGCKSQSEKMKGRTAETHEGIAISARKQKLRNKSTCSGCKSQSEKMKKLSNEQRQLLVHLKLSKISNKDIWHYFVNEIGLKISYSSISSIFNQETKISK